MYKVVQIHIRDAGRIQHFRLNDIELNIGDYCIVETDRGKEYGEVVNGPETVLDADVEKPLKNVVRKITEDDQKHIEQNKQDARNAFGICQERVGAHKLPMKLVYVEYSFDRHKLIFYFTADDRVDFRELVKDLAGIFKVRIELRQIGVRDEAKILGGIGRCGLPLCCARFLRNFVPVNMKMAKIQQLPLNSDKLSGVCGRLLCCLKYEYGMYKKYAKDMPIEGAHVVTNLGKGLVKSVNILKQTVVVEIGENREIIVPVKELKNN